MNIDVDEWLISKVVKLKDTILEQPPYQRGEVWTKQKEQLLIDSILRGYDIPKIYLRRLTSGAYDYEVADGQQRLNAIWKFVNDELALGSDEFFGTNLKKIDGFTVGNFLYSDLNKGKYRSLKKRFDNYKLTIAIVKNSSNKEIRVLFSRLQMGNPLNPAEKRNAILCKIGNKIDNIALHHDFFTQSKISPNRYRHQDYVAHILALLFYENKYDLKADLLLKLYLEDGDSVSNQLLDNIVSILDILKEFDKMSKYTLKNKWSFVDMFWLFYEHKNLLHNDFDVTEIATEFDVFERERLKFKDDPKALLTEGSKSSKKNKDLHDYILAFKASGGLPQNLSIRNNVFKNRFMDILSKKV